MVTDVTAILQGEGPRRARPRLWHHDYLHLRPLARDLRRVLGQAHDDGSGGAATPGWQVLDLGCGASPYRTYFPGSLQSYVRVDLDPDAHPDALARGEMLPFADGTFDGILATQVLLLASDPKGMVKEILRVTRPGGRVWVTCHGAWPDSGTQPENRFGEPDLDRLFAPFQRVTITAEGGGLALPFALLNLGVRQAAQAAQRRFGVAGRLLNLPVTAVCLLSNLSGRLLERLAAGGPLRPFLSHLDRSMPMNYLVVAERAA